MTAEAGEAHSLYFVKARGRKAIFPFDGSSRSFRMSFRTFTPGRSHDVVIFILDRRETTDCVETGYSMVKYFRGGLSYLSAKFPLRTHNLSLARSASLFGAEEPIKEPLPTRLSPSPDSFLISPSHTSPWLQLIPSCISLVLWAPWPSGLPRRLPL